MPVAVNSPPLEGWRIKWELNFIITEKMEFFILFSYEHVSSGAIPQAERVAGYFVMFPF